MRTVRVASLVGVALFAANCSEPIDRPSALEVEVSFSRGVSHNFGTPLSGAEETPPVDTDARGNATFKLSADGTSLDYRLVVANIDNVTQAHIHCGAKGVMGPIVLWLYPPAPPAALIPGTTNGILGSGTATDADVIDRPDSAQCPGGVSTLAELVDKLRTGDAYVNVHTSAFPPGEIRGQIEERGPSN